MKTMDHIYAWTEIDPQGGEGVIYTYIPMLGMGGNLQHRRREIVENFRGLAELHKKSSGHVVRLVKYDRAETLETLK
jgi:hypothetical protein